jgi:hypothetical protein
MEKSIMFEDKKSLQQESRSGVQEFPFCPKRPDQQLSEEQLLLLNEDSDDSDGNAGKDDNDGSDNASDQEDSDNDDDIADITDVLKTKLDLNFSKDRFNSDGASTIATNENASFFPGLFPSNIEEDIRATTRPVAISPRSKYLVGCLKDNVNPRASLITRRKVSHQLKLQHLGDERKEGRILCYSCVVACCLYLLYKY